MTLQTVFSITLSYLLLQVYTNLQNQKEVILTEREKKLLSYDFRQEQSEPCHTTTPVCMDRATDHMILVQFGREF